MASDSIHGFIVILRRQGVVGSRFPVCTGACTIGRGADCPVRIHLQSVSDKHCIINSRHKYPSTITNLSGASGTQLNGEDLGKRTAELRHGDVITMAGRSFRWEYPPSSKFWVKSFGDKSAMVKLPAQYKENSFKLNLSFGGNSNSPVDRHSSTSRRGSGGGRKPASANTSYNVSFGSSPQKSGKRAHAETTPGGSGRLNSPAKQAPSGRANKRGQNSAAVTTNTLTRRSLPLVNIGDNSKTKSKVTKRSGSLAGSTKLKGNTSLLKSAIKNASSLKNSKDSPTRRSGATDGVTLNGFVQETKNRKSVKNTPTRKSIANGSQKMKRNSIVIELQKRKSIAKNASMSTSASNSKIPYKKSFASAVKGGKPQKSTNEGKYAGSLLKSPKSRKRKLELGSTPPERAAKILKLAAPKSLDKKKMAALMVCHGKGLEVKQGDGDHGMAFKSKIPGALKFSAKVSKIPLTGKGNVQLEGGSRRSSSQPIAAPFQKSLPNVKSIIKTPTSSSLADSGKKGVRNSAKSTPISPKKVTFPTSLGRSGKKQADLSKVLYSPSVWSPQNISNLVTSPDLFTPSPRASERRSLIPSSTDSSSKKKSVGRPKKTPAQTVVASGKRSSRTFQSASPHSAEKFASPANLKLHKNAILKTPSSKVSGKKSSRKTTPVSIQKVTSLSDVSLRNIRGVNTPSPRTTSPTFSGIKRLLASPKTPPVSAKKVVSSAKTSLANKADLKTPSPVVTSPRVSGKRSLRAPIRSTPASSKKVATPAKLSTRKSEVLKTTPTSSSPGVSVKNSLRGSLKSIPASLEKSVTPAKLSKKSEVLKTPSPIVLASPKVSGKRSSRGSLKSTPASLKKLKTPAKFSPKKSEVLKTPSLVIASPPVSGKKSLRASLKSTPASLKKLKTPAKLSLRKSEVLKTPSPVVVASPSSRVSGKRSLRASLKSTPASLKKAVSPAKFSPKKSGVLKTPPLVVVTNVSVKKSLNYSLTSTPGSLKKAASPANLSLGNSAVLKTPRLSGVKSPKVSGKKSLRASLTSTPGSTKKSQTPFKLSPTKSVVLDTPSPMVVDSPKFSGKKSFNTSLKSTPGSAKNASISGKRSPVKSAVFKPSRPSVVASPKTLGKKSLRTSSKSPPASSKKAKTPAKLSPRKSVVLKTPSPVVVVSPKVSRASLKSTPGSSKKAKTPAKLSPRKSVVLKTPSPAVVVSPKVSGKKGSRAFLKSTPGSSKKATIQAKLSPRKSEVLKTPRLSTNVSPKVSGKKSITPSSLVSPLIKFSGKKSLKTSFASPGSSRMSASHFESSPRKSTALENEVGVTFNVSPHSAVLQQNITSMQKRSLGETFMSAAQSPLKKSRYSLEKLGLLEGLNLAPVQVDNLFLTSVEKKGLSSRRSKLSMSSGANSSSFSPTKLGSSRRHSSKNSSRILSSPAVGSPYFVKKDVNKSLSSSGKQVASPNDSTNSKKSPGRSSFGSPYDLTDITSFDFDAVQTPKVPKELFVSPVTGSVKSSVTKKAGRSPKNDLTDVRGVRRLMKTPKAVTKKDSQKVKTLFRSPRNDLTNVQGVRRLMKEPKSPKYADISSLGDLFYESDSSPVAKKPKHVSPIKSISKVPSPRRGRRARNVDPVVSLDTAEKLIKKPSPSHKPAQPKSTKVKRDLKRGKKVSDNSPLTGKSTIAKHVHFDVIDSPSPSVSATQSVTSPKTSGKGKTTKLSPNASSTLLPVKRILQGRLAKAIALQDIEDMSPRRNVRHHSVKSNAREKTKKLSPAKKNLDEQGLAESKKENSPPKRNRRGRTVEIVDEPVIEKTMPTAKNRRGKTEALEPEKPRKSKISIRRAATNPPASPKAISPPKRARRGKALDTTEVLEILNTSPKQKTRGKVAVSNSPKTIPKVTKKTQKTARGKASTKIIVIDLTDDEQEDEGKAENLLVKDSPKRNGRGKAAATSKVATLSKEPSPRRGLGRRPKSVAATKTSPKKKGQTKAPATPESAVLLIGDSPKQKTRSAKSSSKSSAETKKSSPIKKPSPKKALRGRRAAKDMTTPKDDSPAAASPAKRKKANQVPEETTPAIIPVRSPVLSRQKTSRNKQPSTTAGSPVGGKGGKSPPRRAVRTRTGKTVSVGESERVRTPVKKVKSAAKSPKGSPVRKTRRAKKS